MTSTAVFSSVFMISFWLLAISYASLDDAKQLHSDLLKDYNKYVRPVSNQSHAVSIYISLAVIAIQEFDEVLERFSVAGAFFLNWIDEGMMWDVTKYGGIGNVFMGYQDVWVPEIILTNPSEKLDSYGKKWQLIRYAFYGLASWQPGDLIKATCSIDVRYFPFDIQTCQLDFYTWGYASSEVVLVPTRNDVETSLLAEHGTWKVINTSVTVENDDLVSKIMFSFRLERKPQYVIVNVVLPILFLCLLNVLVFVLPAESGERVSYAITVLLSIAVFMTIVSDTLPKSSEPLPIISYFLMIDLIISALISLVTVLNLRTYHAKDDKPIPKWLIRIYCLLTCNRRSDSVRPYETDSLKDSLPLSRTKHHIKFGKRNSDTHNGNDIKRTEFKTAVESFSTETSLKPQKAVSWQDISLMFDFIFLIAFTIATIVSFITFLIVTKV